MPVQDAHTYVVIRDRRNGTEKIYSIGNGNELILDKTTAAIRIEGNRIVVDISDGSPNAIHFTNARAVTAPSGSVSQATYTQHDLTGRWRSAAGDVYVLHDSGQKVSLAIESSPYILSAKGQLTKNGSNLTGTMSGVFKNDISRSIRQSELDVTLVDLMTLRLYSDYIKWNVQGVEVQRTRKSIDLYRAD